MGRWTPEVNVDVELGARPAALQAKLDRQRAFWTRQNDDRPVIGFTGSYFSTDTVELIGCEQGRVTVDDIDIDRILAYSDAQAEAWQDCSGDLFWTATPLYQFRWLAAAAGAPVFAGGDSVWAEPFIEDYADLASLAFTEDNPWVQKLWQLTDALVAHAGGRYPVAANEFMSPLSALVDLRGNTRFAFDLYDRPQEVKLGLTRFTGVWSAFVTRQYERIPDWHGGYPSAQRHLWAPGRIIEFSEDPVFMLSSSFHEEIVLPSHHQVLKQVAYPYIHLHSTQLHTLDRLLEMEDLPAIEFTPDHGESIEELIPTIARIQAQKPVLVHAFMSAAEMQMIIDRVPPEGLCVISRAETPDGARRLRDAVL
jgi:hypothetical protein